ncbi:MAG: hypothetical protein NT062_33940 [Proteobacteria bacterium]|nr:hypothetical protein [Pseudomonadota bacterium]
MSKSLVRALVIVTAIAAPLTIAFAKDPADNIGQRHPNLAAAQDLVGKAYSKVEAAQAANEFDLGGHAKRAKEALKLAADEMKLAAEFANKH